MNTCKSKRTCKKCHKDFPVRAVIDGKPRNLSGRSYCLECSPFGERNTSKYKYLVSEGESYCCTCKKPKPASEFYIKDKKTGRLNSMCKECLYAYQDKRRIERKMKMIDIMGGCCRDCKKSFSHQVYHLHHRDPDKKKYGWAQLQYMSWGTVKDEIKKCDLLCANCHIMRHVEEGWGSRLITTGGSKNE